MKPYEQALHKEQAEIIEKIVEMVSDHSHKQGEFIKLMNRMADLTGDLQKSRDEQQEQIDVLRDQMATFMEQFTKTVEVATKMAENNIELKQRVDQLEKRLEKVIKYTTM